MEFLFRKLARKNKVGMAEAYQDVVWSPPMRQRDILPSSAAGQGLVPSPERWSCAPGGMIHPAVFPSFKTPESIFSAPAADLPPGVYLMTVNKPSLFLLGFGLMLLGVCFFSSGLFLGMWIGGKSAGEASSAQVAAGGGGGGNSRFGTLLGFAGTAVGGKTGRVASAGQRAINRDNKQQSRTGGGAEKGVQAHSRSDQAQGEGGNSGGDFDGEGNDAPLPGTVYAVQLGSFAAKENAQDLVSRLKSDSFSAYLIESKDSDGGPIFCVRAGEYHRFDVAASAAMAISDQRQLAAIAVGVKPTDKRLVR